MRPRLSLSLVRRELDEAMRVTTETLSQVTNLLAIVTAPPIETSTIRHVEVLLLQPQVLMVVVITSTGGVTKRLFTFAAPGRLRAWPTGRPATSTSGWSASASAPGCCTSGCTTRRCRAPSRTFLDALAPVFTELEESAPTTACTSRAPSRLLRGDRFGDVSELNALMDMLERRVTLLGVLQLGARPSATCSSGSAPRTTRPALRSLALVAAGYGLPQRRLGTVSVIGPLRMDYGHAITPVREAAAQLSSFIAEVYDER